MQPNGGKEHGVIVPLRPWVFRVVWLLVVTFHAVNMMYLAGVGAMYFYIITPGMSYFVYVLNLPSIVNLRAIGVLLFSFSALHAVVLFHIAISSVRRRRPSFAPLGIKTTVRKLRTLVTRRKVSPAEPRAQRRSPLKSRLQQVWRNFQQVRYYLFSIESPYFDISFGLREAMEISLQTYQAYSLSISVSRKWINMCAVAIIVANCASTSIIYYLHVSKRLTLAQSRLLCVTCDGVLDFCSAVIVPLMVFIPYWRAFDPSIHDFTNSVSYYEVWYTNAVQGNRQVFILNPLDFVSSILPHISVFAFLDTVKGVLMESSVPVASRCAPSPSVPLKNDPLGTSRGRASINKFHRLINQSLHAWAVGWAVFVIYAHHATSNSHAPVTSCRLHNSGWFVKKYSCAVMGLNCHRLETLGDAAALSAVLDEIDAKSLSHLTISHCRKLDVPSNIRRFPMLYAIVVYNSTVNTWPDDASPHVGYHSILNYIMLVRVDLSDDGVLPLALAHSSLPPTLQDIEIFDSNFREFPQDTEIVWKNLCTMYIEFTAIETVPRAVFRLPNLQFFSLAGNPIATIPKDAFMSHASQLQYVTLSGTFLTTLPEKISSRNYESIQVIGIEMTPISTLPSWVYRWYEDRRGLVMGYGSAFCVDPASNDSAGEALRPEVCSVDIGTYLGLMVSDILDEQHALHSM